MRDDLRIRISSRTLWRREGDVVVALDEVSGEAFLLDEIAAHVFEALCDSPVLSQLMERLCARFEGDPGIMRADVEELLGELETRSLVELGDQS